VARFAGDRAVVGWARRAGTSAATRGELGEELVARALRRQGLRLLGRRVRAAPAEVDLLAWTRDGVLVVVEVKTANAPRAGPLRFRPGLHFRPSQRDRLARTASALARGHGALGWRVELWEVTLGTDGAHFETRTVAQGVSNCPVNRDSWRGS
jgi:Holliday junction resolvase-like predicted endonuclease